MVTRDATLPQWLIVVRRDRRDLYLRLREGFETDPRVGVILDRRHGDRRMESRRVEPDRRKQRRRRSTAKDRDLWETAGFRVIYRGVDLTVYAVEDVSPVPGLPG